MNVGIVPSQAVRGGGLLEAGANRSSSSTNSWSGALQVAGNDSPHLDRDPPDVRIDSYIVDGVSLKWTGAVTEVTSAMTDHRGGARVTIGTTPNLSRIEALQMLDSAVRCWSNGLGEWATNAPDTRVTHVERFLDAVAGRREPVVNLLMWEIGKTRADAEKEFDRTLGYLRATITEYQTQLKEAETAIFRDRTVARVERAPVGVTLCMGPSNYPFNETLTTAIPAMLMGNPTIIKPARYGVLLFKELESAFRESFPPGVVSVLYGDGREVVTPLIESGKLDVLAFIGSSSVASKLIKLHPAPHRLKLLLGLGAKNPGIVLPDADLQSTVKHCVEGALSFNGQRCTALKALYVPEALAPAFVTALAEEVGKLRSGLPWGPGVQLTPLYEAGKAAQLGEFIEDAVAKGARIVNDRGGVSDGAFFTPAVLYPVTSDMRVASEEQFGPIIPVIPYRDLGEVIDGIAAGPYGQQISVFGTDLAALDRFTQRVRAITTRVNMNAPCQRGPDDLPFAGRKDSALGTTSVAEMLRFFSTEYVIAATITEPATKVVWPMERRRALSSSGHVAER